MTNYVKYHILPHDTHFSVSDTHIVRVRTRQVWEELELSIFSENRTSFFFANLLSVHNRVTIFFRTTFAMPYALHVAHVTLHSILFFSALGSTVCCRREQLYLKKVSTFSTVSEIEVSPFSVSSPLRATVAQTLPTLLLSALHS